MRKGMIQDLIEKLSPVYEEDTSEWEQIKKEIYGSTYQIFWYASSGLDIYPTVALALGKIPDSILSQMQNAILVMSDYCPNYLSTLKKVYEKLDNGPVNILGKSQYGFEDLVTFQCNIDVNAGYLIDVEAFVDQMIPFRLWDNDERVSFKEAYEYHPSITSHPIPDTDWHIVYFLLRLKSDSGELFFPIVFIGAENLLIFEHLFIKYQIPIEGFFAVRVEGKSGSWDYTHDFNRGKLPRAIEASPINLRPKFWGLEENKWGNAIPKSFKKTCKINGLGFGGCTIFQTNWR